MELSKLIFIVAVFIVVLTFILFPDYFQDLQDYLLKIWQQHRRAQRRFTVKKSIRRRMPTVKQIMRIALPQEN